VNLSINPFAIGPSPTGPSGNAASPTPAGPGTIACPYCLGDIPADSEWKICPYCSEWLRICVWPLVRQNTNAAAAISDHATCFFHPDKAFQACCQRCGRFVCALCDLHLGAEHVCPTCFERGRAGAGPEAGKAEWRSRDVLYDSIALTVGWAWIFVWPVIIGAIPTVIVLHIKYRKAPRSYLVPRSGWRFWMAYVGLIWFPLLIAIPLTIARLAVRH
jgi:hypothetical protein